MSYLDDVSGLKPYTAKKIRIQCDKCGKKYDTLFKSARKNLERNGIHICKECHNQCWDEQRKKEHSDRVKNSELYQAARQEMDNSGPANGMYGKQHSQDSKEKMSRSRTGKTGPNATAWKGGTQSITRRVKGILHTRFGWYARVYQRDKWTCQKCGDKNKIDAHHIRPIVSLIKELLADRTFVSDEEKIEWLVQQPEIKDDLLTNGVTLCRGCHISEHRKWGSHKQP